jgi:hypothetical protein
MGLFDEEPAIVESLGGAQGKADIGASQPTRR